MRWSTIISVSAFIGAAFFGSGMCQENNEKDTAVQEDKEELFSLGVDAGIFSKYLWRGIPLSQGPVVQPSVWASAFGATVSGWGNVTLTEEDGQEWNEIDLTLDYEKEWKSVGIAPSCALYLYPQDTTGEANTAEMTIEFSYPAGPFVLGSQQSVDVWRYRGAYYGNASIAWEKELSKVIAVSAKTSMGFASAKFMEVNHEWTGAGLEEISLEISAFSSPYDWLTLSPSLGFSSLLDKDVRDYWGDDADQIYGGILVSAGF